MGRSTGKRHRRGPCLEQRIPGREKSLHILLEGTPEQIDVQEAIDAIKREEGIDDIHDLHI